MIEMNTFILQGCFKLIKSDDKDENVYDSFMIHERNLQRFYSAVFNIIIMIITMSSILEWFLKDHDTEDWSNDAESFDYMNKLHFQIYSNRKHLF